MTFTSAPFRGQPDDWVRRLRMKFGAVSALHSGLVTGIFNYRQLHAQADAKIRNTVFTCVADRHDLAFDPTFTESPRNEYRIHPRQAGDALFLDIFGIGVMNIDFAAGMNSGMNQRFR